MSFNCLPKPIANHSAVTSTFLFLLTLAFPAVFWAATPEKDSVLLTKNFRFQDGVYPDFASFTHNQPLFDWNALESDMVTSWDNKTLQVARVSIKQANTDMDTIDLSEVWGLCLNGVPYIRLADTLKRNDAWVFAALQVRGRISYYEFEVAVTEQVVVKAYNPVTGQPFREGKVPQKKVITQKMMLDFDSGVSLPFNKENFLDRIKNDAGLWQAVSEIDPEDQTKLFKSLLIYDDRNPVYLP